MIIKLLLCNGCNENAYSYYCSEISFSYQAEIEQKSCINSCNRAIKNTADKLSIVSYRICNYKFTTRWVQNN